MCSPAPAVSVLAEMSPDPSRSATGRVLEMSGDATAGSAYSKLCHLLIVPQTKPGLPRSAVLKAYRVAGVKVAVHLARAALEQKPASTETFEPIGAEGTVHEGLPRVVYIGQIFSRQRKPAVDEPILYGTNTDGMLPRAYLHPDEWLDGALVPSLNSWFGGTETYFYQNHPVILDLYRRHQAREINFVGTVATVAGNDNVDRERQCHAAANLVKWTLRADGAVMTKYGGGLPHADLVGNRALVGTIRHQDRGDGLRCVARPPRRVGALVQRPGSQRHRLQRRQRHRVRNRRKSIASSPRNRNWPNCSSDP